MRRIFFLLLLLFSFFTFALDTKLSLELTDKANKWDVGEIKDFKIILHPISEVNRDDLKQSLLSRNLADLIKILSIKTQGPLKENPQYYIIKARGLLLKEPKPNFPLIWDYRGMAVAVDYSRVSFSNIPATSKQLFIFDKNVASELNKFLIAGLVIFLIAFLIVISYIIKKMKHDQERKRDYKIKLEKFKEVSNREDHEYIYQYKDDFSNLFENKESFREYLEVINSIQYKKSWDDRELEALKNAHARAKESIVVR